MSDMSTTREMASTVVNVHVHVFLLEMMPEDDV